MTTTAGLDEGEHSTRVMGSKVHVGVGVGVVRLGGSAAIALVGAWPGDAGVAKNRSAASGATVRAAAVLSRRRRGRLTSMLAM
jgi:hypothetical protein